MGTRRLILWLVALVLAPAALAQSNAPQVMTDRGPVIGAAHDGVRVFNAIPYAAAPVGPLRFAPPRARPRWTTPVDGRIDPPACPQSPGSAIGKTSETEDCLVLDVIAPATAAPHPRAVMVWIHGNGAKGYAGSPNYDPARLAREQDLVVVTINYRLGLLGTLVTPALDTRAGRSGNLQLRDQQAALRWVQRNIARFGGDPARVTVAGCSWGGNSVVTLLASPASKGLFAGAIIESLGGRLSQPRARAEAVTRTRILPGLGCAGARDVAACLRALPVATLVASAANDLDLQRVPDPVLMPRDPISAFASGRFVRVPVLIGSNHDEGHFFVPFGETARHRRVTEADYAVDIAALADFGLLDNATAALRRYPSHSFASPGFAESRLVTDLGFACPAEAVRRRIARYAPVYGYEFDEPDPAQQEPLPPGTEMPNASYHTTEETYLFDTDVNHARLTGRAAELGRTVRDYWGAFVRTGNPDGGAHPIWPRYDRAGTLLKLRHDPVPGTGFAADHRCAAAWRNHEGLLLG